MSRRTLIGIALFCGGALTAALILSLLTRGPSDHDLEHERQLMIRRGELEVQKESERGRMAVQTESERGRLGLWETMLTQAPLLLEIEGETLVHVPEMINPGGKDQRLERVFYRLEDGRLIQVPVDRLGVDGPMGAPPTADDGR